MRVSYLLIYYALDPESNERDRNLLLLSTTGRYTASAYIRELYILHILLYAYITLRRIVCYDIYAYKTRGTAVTFLNQRKVAAITGL